MECHLKVFIFVNNNNKVIFTKNIFKIPYFTVVTLVLQKSTFFSFKVNIMKKVWIVKHGITFILREFRKNITLYKYLIQNHPTKV